MKYESLANGSPVPLTRGEAEDEDDGDGQHDPDHGEHGADHEHHAIERKYLKVKKCNLPGLAVSVIEVEG